MKYIGYHDESKLPLKRGQTVTIKKGTKIHCMLRGIVEAKKTFKIKIHHLMPGCSWSKRMITDRDRETLKMTWEEINAYPGDFIPQSNPGVSWPGTGGYWQTVDINEIPETFQEPK